MSTGRITRKKYKKCQKRQRPGAQAAYKRKIRIRRRKEQSLRVNVG
ncbi:MAG: hypothetical protein ACF8Q5_14255 [Phycisphaerales bacterium JB040]